MRCFATSSLTALTVLSLYAAAAAGTVLWEFQGIEDVECVAPMGDLDGDRIPESALMHYDSGASGQEFLTVIRGSSRGRAEVLWSTKPWGGVSGGGGYGDRCLDTVADLDGDGYGDRLLGTAWGSRSAFHISGLEGSVLATHDSYDDDETGWCYQVSSVGDVNQDDLPETAAAFGNDSRSVFLLDGASRGDTDELWRYRSPGLLGLCRSATSA